MAGKRHFTDLTTRITRLTELTRPHLARLGGNVQTRQGAVASALVAGAVATTALTVATQAPAQAAVGAAAPITTLAEGGKAAKSLTAGGTDVVSQAQAETGEAKSERKSGETGEAGASGKAESKTRRAAKAEEVIKLAKTQVGISEDGAGNSKYGEWFAGTERAKETMERDAGGGSPKVYEDAAWCSMFLAWVADQAGTDALGKGDPYTVTYARSFDDQGRWGTKPKPGAIVFFDWNGGKSINGIDHVGMVTEVVDGDTVKTVEGNISNEVVSKTRTSGTIVGYGYPEYAE